MRFGAFAASCQRSGGARGPPSYSLAALKCERPRPGTRGSPETNLAVRLASGWHPVTGQGTCPGSKPHPPLPFAVLGLIRLFDIQPQRGRLRGRAALADSDEPNARG